VRVTEKSAFWALLPAFWLFAGHRHLSGNSRNASRLARGLEAHVRCRTQTIVGHGQAFPTGGVIWRCRGDWRPGGSEILPPCRHASVHGCILQCLFGGVVAYFRTKSRVNANGGLGPALHARSLCVGLSVTTQRTSG
jgi:hypothetical protein